MCPACKHIFDSKDMVECIKEGNKKGKVVCWDCGMKWLHSHAKTPPNLKGPAQSVGQQQMRME